MTFELRETYPFFGVVVLFAHMLDRTGVKVWWRVEPHGTG